MRRSQRSLATQPAREARQPRPIKPTKGRFAGAPRSSQRDSRWDHRMRRPLLWSLQRSGRTDNAAGLRECESRRLGGGARPCSSSVCDPLCFGVSGLFLGGLELALEWQSDAVLRRAFDSMPASQLPGGKRRCACRGHRHRTTHSIHLLDAAGCSGHARFFALFKAESSARLVTGIRTGLLTRRR